MIEYAIIENSRSKRASLKITPHDGLVVVIPPRYNKDKIPKLLHAKKSWIKKHIGIWQKSKQGRQDSTGKPTSLTLPALNTTWQVSYKNNVAAYREGKQTLTLNNSAWENILRNWCTTKAKQHLPQLLEDISAKTGLIYKGVSIRNQKGRWGSCTSKSTINLNMKLIFLPPHLAEHILIHELAHTVHMNHSANFWALVEKHDPHYKKHNEELKSALLHVPQWMQGSNIAQREVLEL